MLMKSMRTSRLKTAAIRPNVRPDSSVAFTGVLNLG